jgi:hypothetical protein
MNLHATPQTTRPQSRDVALIRMLAEKFRILNREQIGELFPIGSIRRRNFRLKKLSDAGYLSTRTLAQMGNVTKHGYYLGPRAAELFPNPTERKVMNSIRAQVPQLAESGLAHRMLVDSVHIRFLTARRQYPEYKLLTWIDQYSPWWQELEKYGVPVQADGYGEYLVLLHFDNLFTFFLEVDRGTERGQTLQEKIDRYIQYAETGAYEAHFAAKPFRVLFITTTDRRMDGVLRMMKHDTRDLFWVTTWERFTNSKLLDAYWRRPHRPETFSLLSHV